jgi:hypothetical protein
MSKMTARLLVAAVLLLTAANWFYVRRARAAAAKPQIVYGQANCRSYVPPEWGDYKGSSDNYGVAFQDSSGTLRFITNVACEATPQVALEIRRGNPPH